MDEFFTIDVEDEVPASRERFFGLDCQADPDNFRGAIKGRRLERGAIARCRASRQTLRRTPALISGCTDATVALVTIAKGQISVEQNGGEAAVDANAFCLFDDSRPFDAKIASDFLDGGLLHLPKASLTRRLGNIDDLVFKPLDARDPLQRLILNFANGLTDALDRIDEATVNVLLDQLLDLLALSVAQAKRDSVDPSTHRAAVLLRVKAHIKAHLRDESLAIENAAHALGISPRYINALFEGEHTSFGRYVLARRLEGAHRDMIDPRRINMQIAEIAYGWGFSSPTHFGRAFKRRFGITPREARMERVLA